MPNARKTTRREVTTRRRADVISLLLNGYSHSEVARFVDCSKSAIDNFAAKNKAELNAAKKEITTEVVRQAKDYAVAKRVNRIARLDDTDQRITQVIEERAADPAEYANLPGYRSGLMVHKLKKIGTETEVIPGEDGAKPRAVTRDVFADELEFDTGLVGRRIDVVDEAAKQMGESKQPEQEFNNSHYEYIRAFYKAIGFDIVEGQVIRVTETGRTTE